MLTRWRSKAAKKGKGKANDVDDRIANYSKKTKKEPKDKSSKGNFGLMGKRPTI